MVPIVGSVIARAVNIFHVRYHAPPSSLGKKVGTEEKVDFLKTIPVLQQLLHAQYSSHGFTPQSSNVHHKKDG